ncbi:hypothetical protein LOB84_08100, partial [Lactobacillus delbrueckii subsp. lactis]|uniref:hypothetical protein n=1 Tax=Lactobacillus delbrueckii TaxID=1584 RepID=UPI001E582CC3
TTERTRHFLVKKPKKILQLRLEDKNVFNAIHLNSIGYVFEFGMGNIFYAVKLTGRFAKMKTTPTTHVTSTKATQS